MPRRSEYFAFIIGFSIGVVFTSFILGQPIFQAWLFYAIGGLSFGSVISVISLIMGTIRDKQKRKLEEHYSYFKDQVLISLSSNIRKHIEGILFYLKNHKPLKGSCEYEGPYI